MVVLCKALSRKSRECEKSSGKITQSKDTWFIKKNFFPLEHGKNENKILSINGDK